MANPKRPKRPPHKKPTQPMICPQCKKELELPDHSCWCDVIEDQDE